MRSLTFSIVITTFLVSGALAAGKSYLYEKPFDTLNAALEKKIPEVPDVARKVTPLDMIPEDCIIQGQEKRREGDGIRCTQDKIKAWEVTYPDCSDPWRFCRCEGVGPSEEQMMDHFGRVPVGLRQSVRNVMAYHDGVTYAYELEHDFVLLGDERAATPTIMMHETNHAVDGDYHEISDSPEFRDAIAKDTCVASNYAKTSLEEQSPPKYGEVYADALVMAIFMHLHDGKLTDGVNPDCMKNQLAHVKLYAQRYLEQTTCSLISKARPSRLVSKTGAQRLIRKAIAKRLNSNPKAVIEPPEVF